jgi:hypothetical protein
MIHITLSIGKVHDHTEEIGVIVVTNPISMKDIVDLAEKGNPEAQAACLIMDQIREAMSLPPENKH